MIPARMFREHEMNVTEIGKLPGSHFVLFLWSNVAIFCNSDLDKNTP